VKYLRAGQSIKQVFPIFLLGETRSFGSYVRTAVGKLSPGDISRC
jgi:hypothetical protein